jgi:hypothetical protein
MAIVARILHDAPTFANPVLKWCFNRRLARVKIVGGQAIHLGIAQPAGCIANGRLR